MDANGDSNGAPSITDSSRLAQTFPSTTTSFWRLYVVAFHRRFEPTCSRRSRRRTEYGQSLDRPRLFSTSGSASCSAASIKVETFQGAASAARFQRSDFFGAADRRFFRGIRSTSSPAAGTTCSCRPHRPAEHHGRSRLGPSYKSKYSLICTLQKPCINGFVASGMAPTLLPDSTATWGAMPGSLHETLQRMCASPSGFISGSVSTRT